MDWPVIVWLSVMVLCIIAEASTVTLVSLWFALGALAALITGIFTPPELFWLQSVVFAVCSGGTLALTWPVCKRYRQQRSETRTNADRNIGEVALCTGRIDNDAGTGTAHLLGKEWTARSADGVVIEEGSKVRVTSINGVKLMVSLEAAPVTHTMSGG